MATEAEKDKATDVASRALKAIGHGLSPLIDGLVVVGIELVVVVRSPGVIAPSRMTLARSPEAQQLVRSYAERIYAGMSDGPRKTENGVYPAPPKN